MSRFYGDYQPDALPPVTVYWQIEPGFGVFAWLPGQGWDQFDSFGQLDMYCTVQFFGYSVSFVEITSEAQRLELVAQGVFDE